MKVHATHTRSPQDILKNGFLIHFQCVQRHYKTLYLLRHHTLNSVAALDGGLQAILIKIICKNQAQIATCHID